VIVNLCNAGTDGINPTHNGTTSIFSKFAYVEEMYVASSIAISPYINR